MKVAVKYKKSAREGAAICYINDSGRIPETMVNYLLT